MVNRGEKKVRVHMNVVPRSTMNTSLNTLESVLKRVLRQTFRNEVDSLKNVGETDIFSYEWYRTKTRLAQRKKGNSEMTCWQRQLHHLHLHKEVKTS